MPQQQHISEDRLDLYALGKLPQDELPRVEEHLLACEGCRARVAQADEFAFLFREAAANPEARPRLRWLPVWRRRAMAGVAAAAAVAAVLVVTRREPSPLAPAIVSMQAMRGPEAPAEIDAGRPAILVFDIDAADGSYEAQIVDTTGKEALRSATTSREGRLSVSAGRLSKGSYWVRVYRSGGGEPIVEYGLRVR